jgi:DNA-directed RNA polymerase II subunit RPB1
MTQKGKLTSITRHGINRLDTGPLRKCSFEETVEILLESSLHNEHDQLLGITENIIVGNMSPLGTGFFDIKIDAECI